MNKFIYLLIVSLILIACSKSDDGGGNGDTGGNNNSEDFSVQIAGDYLNNTTMQVFLSDQTGGIITSGFAQNNSTLTLQADFDSQTIDATFVLSFGNNSYRTQTFKDVEPNTVRFVDNTQPVSQGESVTINITNTNEIPYLYVVGTSIDANFETSNSNNGTLSIDAVLPSSSGGYFTSLIDFNGDTPSRYHWVKNASGGEEFTASFLDLPVLNQLNNVTFPDNSRLKVNVTGVSDNDARAFKHRIFEWTYSFGDGNDITYYVPDTPIFDRMYYSYEYLANDATNYYIQRGGDSPSNISLPSFDLTINSSELSAINIETTGAYDTYSVSYIDFAGSGGSRTYAVHGKQSPSISLSQSVLYDAIFANNNQVNAADLEFSRGLLINDSSNATYIDFVTFEAGGIDTRDQDSGEFVEAIAKLE